MLESHSFRDYVGSRTNRSRVRACLAWDAVDKINETLVGLACLYALNT